MRIIKRIIFCLLLSGILFSAAMPAQKIYYMEETNPKEGRKNIVSTGLSVGTIDYFAKMLFNLEYERLLSERFSLGGLLIRPLFILPLQETDTPDGIYLYTRHLYLYGMLYYRLPLAPILCLRFGLGGGAGHHSISKNLGDISGYEDKWLPYINLSAQLIFTLRNGNELRAAVVGPSNVSYSTRKLNPYSDRNDRMYALSLQFVYGIKF